MKLSKVPVTNTGTVVAVKMNPVTSQRKREGTPRRKL